MNCGHHCDCGAFGDGDGDGVICGGGGTPAGVAAHVKPLRDPLSVEIVVVETSPW